jgi:hypothetical protein
MLATPASGVALAAGQGSAQSAIQIRVRSPHVAFDGEETVTGTASRSNAGQPVSLEFASGHGSTWRTVQTTRTRADGSFKFVESLRESGRLRAALASRTSPVLARASRSDAPSAARTVTVGSKLHVPTHSFNVLAGQTIDVGGRLLPELGGRRVVLLGRSGGSWHALASTRTGSHGGFSLRYTTGGTGHLWLRVEFKGDRFNTRARSYAGQLTAYRQSVASWYDDGGSTACGFHAFYGVANKSLPCGTQVQFRYGGRTVTAVVDDRGPYVGGRDWDFNQNTAAALGFNGVDTVWSSM